MERKRFVVITQALLLGLVLLENNIPIPRTNAFLNGDNFVTEITTVPPEVNVVATDSTGRLFLGAGNDIYRSVDAGASWVKVLDGPTGFSHLPYLLFVDSRDYIYAMITNASGSHNQLYRSINNGDSWSKVQSNVAFGWHMCESSNGSLYWNTYTTSGNDYVYASHNDGETWSIFYDLTNQVDHFHWVEVNPANNTQVYVTTGDGQNDASVQRYNGASWHTIVNDTTFQAKYQTTSVFFDDSYVYFMNDASERSWRMPLAGSSSADFEIILDNRVVFTESNNFYDACKVNGAYVAGTSEGQLWGSWDGKHWVKVWDETTGIIRSITRRGFPQYFVNTDTNKLYRLSLTKEDIIRLYYQEYRLRRGKETNSDNYFLEQEILNGTEYIDLTHVALSDVQAVIVGQSIENAQNDAGFESGTLEQWYFGGTGLRSIVSGTDYVYEGNFAVNITKNSGDTEALWFCNSPYTSITMQQGDIAVASVWAKSNQTLVQGIGLSFYNESSGYALTPTEYFEVSTSWQRFKWWYRSSRGNPLIVRAQFFSPKGESYQIFVDASKFEMKKCHFAKGDVGSTESIQFWDYSPTTYAVSTLHTINPILTLNGRFVSYSGQLTNGTASPATNLTGIFTGPLKVTANIRGSGQAILRITGKRILYEDSTILKGRKGNVYYGRYYNTFSPETTTSDLIVVTNLQANITSLTSTINLLTLTVDSLSGTTSSTKVYVGYEGQPKDVSGATSWEYDSASRILTINAFHSSTTQITVQWRLVGDVNWDGTVDATDLRVFSQAFGSTGGPPPSANWDPKCDCNGDNKIDASDLFSLGQEYGKIDP